MGGEEDNANDLPYRSEYAKSGRAKCKGCKVEIPKGDLRLAAMTQVLGIDPNYVWTMNIEHTYMIAWGVNSISLPSTVLSSYQY